MKVLIIQIQLTWLLVITGPVVRLKGGILRMAQLDASGTLLPHVYESWYEPNAPEEEREQPRRRRPPRLLHLRRTRTVSTLWSAQRNRLRWWRCPPKTVSMNTTSQRPLSYLEQMWWRWLQGSASPASVPMAISWPSGNMVNLIFKAIEYLVFWLISL